MAHFYGTIQGSRGEASRLGHKSSGLTTTAASWQGAVQVSLYEKDGIDYARVAFRKHRNAGSDAVIYDGPVNGKAFVATGGQAGHGGDVFDEIAEHFAHSTD